MQRRTKQRETIKQVFKDVHRPLGPNEVLEEAQQQLPNLGIATVYRALNDLVDDGWLCPVDIPGETTRYELNNLPHHHHFHCRKCRRVFDMHMDVCPSGLEKLAPAGFRVEAHEITLVGLCADCAQKEK